MTDWKPDCLGRRLAGNSTLHAHSFHPSHLKSSIPYGEMLRLRRNCSCIDDWKTGRDEMVGGFGQRHYKKDSLVKTAARGELKSRESLFFPKRHDRKSESIIRLIATFSKQESQLRHSEAVLAPSLRGSDFRADHSQISCHCLLESVLYKGGLVKSSPEAIS